MKKKFIVVAIFPEFIKVEDNFDDDKKTALQLLVTSNEGVFDTYADAMERLTGMIEEESKNYSEMYFNIIEVYSKN